jgi:hypothetical protein
MTRGWNDVMGRLQQRFETGPLDWSKEFESKSQQSKDDFTL